MLTVSGLQLTMMVSKPGVLQRVGGMDAAIVELDALPIRFGPPPRMMTFWRSVGSASQAGRRSRLRRSNTCKASSRRTRRRRCRCACRPDAHPPSRSAATSVSLQAREFGEPLVRETQRLQPPQRAGFGGRPLPRLRARPRRSFPVRAGTTGRTCCNRGCPRPTARRATPAPPSTTGPAGLRQSRAKGVRLAVAGRLDRVEAGKPVSMLRKPFCSASAKLRPMAIASPTDSSGGQQRRRAGEFLEGEARDLDHDVVDGRLEAGRRVGVMSLTSSSSV